MPADSSDEPRSQNSNPLTVFGATAIAEHRAGQSTEQSRKGQSKPGLYRGRSTGKETRNASKRETRDAHDLVTGYTYYNCVFVTKGVDATNRRCSKKSDRRTERQPKKKPKKAEKSKQQKQQPQSTPLLPPPPSRVSGTCDQPWSVTDGRLTSHGRPHKQKEKASQSASHTASQPDRQTGGREAEGSRGEARRYRDNKKRRKRCAEKSSEIHVPNSPLSRKQQQPLCIKCVRACVRACARARGGRPPAQTHAPDSSIGDSGRLFGDAPTTELGLRPAAGDFLSALCPCSSPSPCCCW